MMYADMIIYGGSCFAGKDLPEDFNYVAVKDGKILSMGKSDEWKEYEGPDTQKIELPPEALMVPDFTTATCI